MADLYDTLGVKRGASEKEIRSAYRKLARKHHPDVNPGDSAAEKRFKQINAAHDVLSDPDKRRKYDKYGDNWEHADEIERMQRGRGQRPGSGGSFRFTTSGGPNPAFEDLDLGSLFGGMFSGGAQQTGGRRRAPRQEQPPADVEQPVDVTFEEAFSGTTRILMVEGDHGEQRRLEVKIPRGVDNGSRIRMAGEGRATFSGRRSDLYLVVQVKPSPRFERKGDDLYTDAEVPLSTPVLGGETEIQAPDKKVALRLPAGTQNGQTFRLNGLGMPKLSDPEKRGDLFARVKVKLPATPDEETRKLFEELRDKGL